MAGIIDLLSNNSDVAPTPDGLRKLAASQASTEPLPEPAEFKIHRLSTRLGIEQVDQLISRYGNGESARSLAPEYDVAPSALIRLLRERNVVVRQQVVTAEMEQTLTRGHEAGMTVAELEEKHELSHGAVLRALHRGGVKMRAKAPRRKSG